MYIFLFLSLVCVGAQCNRFLELRGDLAFLYSNKSNAGLEDLVPAKSENMLQAFGRLRKRGLFARQLTCPAGSSPCEDGITCCPTGEECVTDGCCPSGQTQCGSSHCYNPSTEICCSDGSWCSKGYDCVTGGCCPSGLVPCGSSKCYDASADVCCSDGTSCPKGQVCVPGGCCPSGEEACGSEKCYNPNTDKCCSGSGEVWGCTLPADCCENPGVCFEDGEQCCENGSCPDEDTCCANECCRSIAYCGNDGWCSAKTTATPTLTMTLTSSPTLTMTPTSSPASEQISTPKFSTPKLPSSSTTTSSSALPTIIFPYLQGLTDDLVENMCLGLRSQNAPRQSQVLTYGGNSAAQRKQTQCNGGKCCTGQTKQSGSNAGMPLSCDEYPFASTVEGGSGAHVGCIVAWQNGLQGWYLSNFFRDYNMQVNDQFVMEITGIDCDTVKDTDIPGCNKFGKRDSGNITAGAESLLFQSNTSSQNALVIPFGDLTPGQYSTRVKIPAGTTISNLSVLDNTGFLYSSTGSLLSYSNLSSSGAVVSWTLSDYEYGVSVVADTDETALNATWQLAVNTSLPSSSAATGKKRSGVVGMLMTTIIMGLLVLMD